DDDRCAFLQDAITQSFGRPLALAALRGKLGREGDAPVAPREPRVARRSMQESAAQGGPRSEPADAGGGPGAPAPPGSAPYAPAAQWWIAARAGWAALRERRLGFADAVRETVQRFPYLLSVPIQASTHHEGGALAEGYALLLEHVEKLEPGFVKEALMRLNPQ